MDCWSRCTPSGDREDSSVQGTGAVAGVVGDASARQVHVLDIREACAHVFEVALECEGLERSLQLAVRAQLQRLLGADACKRGLERRLRRAESRHADPLAESSDGRIPPASSSDVGGRAH